MDIKKLSGQEKVSLCKKYFFIGLALLPFVWFTNFCWFFCEAFRSPPSEYRPVIRRYVIMSGLGCLFWLIAIIAWETVFQNYRSQGLAWSDYISFVFPSGRI